MSKKTFKLKPLAIAVAVSNMALFSVSALTMNAHAAKSEALNTEQSRVNPNTGEREIEQIVVTAEKRNESLQDLSQAVTALTAKDLDNKYISSFVDLSAIAPGVTVAKNEGFKTIISIRGVGNEANQNATANPSVSYHMVRYLYCFSLRLANRFY